MFDEEVVRALINLNIAAVVVTLTVVYLNPSIQSSVLATSLAMNPVPATVNIMELVAVSKADVIPEILLVDALKLKTQPLPPAILQVISSEVLAKTITSATATG